MDLRSDFKFANNRDAMGSDAENDVFFDAFEVMGLSAGSPGEARLPLDDSKLDVESRTTSIRRDTLMDKEIRALLLQGCEELQQRNAFFPEEITFVPRTPRTFLNLPTELREYIYSLSIPTYEPGRTAKTAAQIHTLNLTRSSPTIQLKFAGQLKIPNIAFASRQIFHEVVSPAYEQHPYSLKIDCTKLRAGTAIADFWPNVLPRRIARMIRRMNVEYRCSKIQWTELRDDLYAILRAMPRDAVVKIRLIIDYPRQEHNVFAETLPPFYDQDEIGTSTRTWFKGYARVLNQEFRALENFDCVHQLQFLHLNEDADSHETLHHRGRCENVMVLTRNDKGWDKSEGISVFDRRFDFMADEENDWFVGDL